MFDTVTAARPGVTVELSMKVRVKLKPMNLVTSKHSSLEAQDIGMFPVAFKRAPSVKSKFLATFRTIFVEFDRMYLAPPLLIVPFQSNLRNVVLPVPLGMVRE